VLSLEVLWSVRVRVLGFLGGGGGGGEGREAGWGGYASGGLRAEMPPECWAALLLLEEAEEEGGEGTVGKAKKGRKGRKGGSGGGAENGLKKEGKGEGMEEGKR